MKTALLLAFCLAVAPLQRGIACAWDSDTLRDEAKQKGSLYDFITGQFPHHGAGYYRERVRRLAAKAAPTFEERNDLAVAYIRLERWKDAESLLQQNLAEKPEDYFTMSNLGVLEKKRGNFAASAAWISKALTIKPEGHLGLGDWYLLNLKFRVQTASVPKAKPVQNFLGEAYADAFNPRFTTIEPAKQMDYAPDRFDRLQRLLENDQTFADGFLVMGDFLANRGDLNLAYLCYKKASTLNHPNPPEVARRIASLYSQFHMATFDGGGPKAYRAWMQKITAQHSAEAARAFSLAEKWQAQFQETEGALAGRIGDTVAEPSRVEEELVRRGVKRPLP